MQEPDMPWAPGSDMQLHQDRREEEKGTAMLVNKGKHYSSLSARWLSRTTLAAPA